MDLPEESESPSKTESNFVFETRVKFLTKITDFWGVRLCIKSIGAFDIKRMMFVVEIGAGTC